MRVLVVDDSVVFRSQIREALSSVSNLEVVGTMANGNLAIKKLEQTPVDLITLDYEMPEMNGLQVIEAIRRQGHKARIILFSSQTPKGGHIALEALRAGADDIVAKPTSASDNADPSSAIRLQLVPKILQFFPEPESSRIVARRASAESLGAEGLKKFRPQAIVIASSTGGPGALEKIFSGFQGPLRCPILIAQHMPPVFTQSLAQRLSDISGIEFREGRQMEFLENRGYVAPGDYHMTLVESEGRMKIRLDQGPQVNSVRPAADNLFNSAAELLGSKCMAYVLTGMGADGCVGVQKIKQLGGQVMIQDQASCVVFGMPGAVYQAKTFDAMGDPNEIREVLENQSRGVTR